MTKNHARNPLVTLLFAFCLMGLVFLSGCDEEPLTERWGTLHTQLEETGLSYSEMRLSYETDEAYSRLGIDVSEQQGIIDWDAVASDGIEFAFVRLGRRGTTEGGLYEDAYVAENIAGAKAAGLEVHGYFFSQAVSDSEAAQEADLAIQIARSVGLTEGHIAYDLETDHNRTLGLESSVMENCAYTFCSRIEGAGYQSMVYGNKNELRYFGEQLCADKKIWFAQYTLENPESPCPFEIWQYSSSGVVAGIMGSVDMNLWIMKKS